MRNPGRRHKAGVTNGREGAWKDNRSGCPSRVARARRPVRGSGRHACRPRLRHRRPRDTHRHPGHHARRRADDGRAAERPGHHQYRASACTASERARCRGTMPVAVALLAAAGRQRLSRGGDRRAQLADRARRGRHVPSPPPPPPCAPRRRHRAAPRLRRRRQGRHRRHRQQAAHPPAALSRHTDHDLAHRIARYPRIARHDRSRPGHAGAAKHRIRPRPEQDLHPRHRRQQLRRRDAVHRQHLFRRRRSWAMPAPIPA